MSIIKGIISLMTQDFSEPIIVKDSCEAKVTLDNLLSISSKLNDEGEQVIEQEIKLLQSGIYGEDSIAFELKNSHLPLVVLRDLQLSYAGLSAQIDFLVLTPKVGIVIECKNMIGNIEVNANGDFIRTFSYGKRFKKEGIYSPITQNRRHLELLRKIMVEQKGSILSRIFSDLHFEQYFHPIVVVANPKSILNIKYAKKEVKDKIIRGDQLIEYIRRCIINSDMIARSYDDLAKMAEMFLDHHHAKRIDVEKTYGQWIENSIVDVPPVSNVKNESMGVVSKSLNIEEHPVYIALKNYRLLKSRSENIKAFYIYSNSQLESLVQSMPKSIEELLKVSGFNQVKCEKYGKEIIEIILKNTLDN